MNLSRFRSKRIVIPAVAAVVALGVGGVVWSTAANADVTGTDRDRVGNAAVQAVGGGTVTDVEASDDQGVAYEVDVRTADNKEWEVELDSAFKVLNKTEDTP